MEHVAGRFPRHTCFPIKDGGYPAAGYPFCKATRHRAHSFRQTK